MYYSRLLFEFLKTLKKIDIYSCISSRPGQTQMIRTAQRKIIDLIGNVLLIFSENKLLKHLQVVESALDSLENYTVTGTDARTLSLSSRTDRPIVVTPSKSSFSRTVGTPNGISALVEQGYANCGPVIRAQVAFFEGKSEYVPVFLSMNTTGQGVESIYDLVCFNF